jgi:hypothetical protein
MTWLLVLVPSRMQAGMRINNGTPVRSLPFLKKEDQPRFLWIILALKYLAFKRMYILLVNKLFLARKYMKIDIIQYFLVPMYTAST